MRRAPAILALLAAAAAAAACGGTYPDAGAGGRAACRRGTCRPKRASPPRRADSPRPAVPRRPRREQPEPPPAPGLKPPPIVLKSEAGRQEAVLGSYCITSVSEQRRRRGGYLHGLGVPPSQGAHRSAAGRVDQDHDRRDAPRRPGRLRAGERLRVGGHDLSARLRSRESRCRLRAFQGHDAVGRRSRARRVRALGVRVLRRRRRNLRGCRPARWACSSTPIASPRSFLSTRASPSARIPSSPDGRRNSRKIAAEAARG